MVRGGPAAGPVCPRWPLLVPFQKEEVPAFFAGAYIFVIMEIGSRRIIHVNVTSNPTLTWVKQQIREATAEDVAPRFIVHDNDGIFGQHRRRVIVEREGRRCSYRCHLDRWLDDVIGIKGLPIPYGTPNTSGDASYCTPFAV